MTHDTLREQVKQAIRNGAGVRVQNEGAAVSAVERLIAERERLLRERIEGLPRAAGAEAVDDQLPYVALADVLAVFDG